MKQNVATPIGGGNFCGVCLGLDRAISLLIHSTYPRQFFKKKYKRWLGLKYE